MGAISEPLAWRASGHDFGPAGGGGRGPFNHAAIRSNSIQALESTATPAAPSFNSSSSPMWFQLPFVILLLVRPDQNYLSEPFVSDRRT
jgi:hypothetical protein